MGIIFCQATYLTLPVKMSDYKLEVCVRECNFPGTGYFPKKFGKFPVPAQYRHSGLAVSRSYLRSGNIREFPNASRIKSCKFNFGTRRLSRQ